MAETIMRVARHIEPLEEDLEGRAVESGAGEVVASTPHTNVSGAGVLPPTAPATGSLAAEGIAATTAALSAVGHSIALASLIFAGPLAGGLPRAATAFVLGGAVVNLAIGLFGKARPIVAITQDGPAVVMVAVAGRLAAGGSDDPARDMLVAIALASALAGIAMLVVARLGLSNAVRFLPNTVIGGFAAGTGWLLLKGSLEVMLNRPLGLDDLDVLRSGANLAFWVPGVALGLLLVVLSRSGRVPAASIGLTALAGCGLFYAVALTRSSLGALEEGGWLIGPFDQSAGVRLLGRSDVVAADWASLGGVTGPLLTVVGVAVVALLMNLSSLEVVTNERVDLDAELATAGVANLVVAPLGGMVAFHGLGRTLLARRMGATTQWTAIGAGAIGVAFAVFGTALVGWVPRMIAGGLLALIGFGLLADWSRDLVRSTSRAERSLSVAILGVVAMVGILEGIGFGVVAACAIFIYRYSRIDPVRLESSGATLASRVDRTEAELARLGDVADGLAVFELHGYLFFGSVRRVADRIRDRSEDASRPLHHVIVDFRKVTGVDPSGFAVLREIASLVSLSGGRLVLSNLAENTARELWRTAPQLADAVDVRADLDWALEAVEERLLEGAEQGERGSAARRRPGHETADPITSPLSTELRGWFKVWSVDPGVAIMVQGEASDTLYVVEAGDLRATTIDAAGVEHQLRRVGAGALLGEIGFVTNKPRTASVVAVTGVELLTMARPVYQCLRAEQPELALELHDYILNGQAERTASLSDNLARALR